jgi:hypothetical protein
MHAVTTVHQSSALLCSFRCFTGKTGYAIHMHFKENPFFSNKVITKVENSERL